MCCGNQRQPMSINTPSVNATVPPAASRTRSGPSFAYYGETALTVVSPMTGRIYRFGRPGAMLITDPRDASWLAFVPHLRPVR